MKVTLFGKEYFVIFNMAVQISYEEMSEKPFDLSTLDTQKATMQLCYASLKEANDKLPFTFGEMLKDLSVSETGELKNAVIASMNEWFEIPKVTQKDDQPQQEQDEKNA